MRLVKVRLGYENLRPMQTLYSHTKFRTRTGGKSLVAIAVGIQVRGIACCTVIVVSPPDAERPRARGTQNYFYSRHRVSV